MKTFVNVLLVGAFIDTAFAIGVRGLNSSSTHTSVPSTTSSKSSTSISSSLSSITAAANASMCTSDLGLGVYSGYSTDSALQCQCAQSFMNWFTTSNPPTRTITRDQESGATAQTLTTFGSTITTVVQYVTTEVFTVTGNFGGADGFDFPGTAQPPCCSSCTIAAQTVNLFYWPTPAIPNQATEFVNSDGYTFVSPSVYMGFTSLSAGDLCGNVGKVYTSTTFAFGPSELSTYGSPLVSTMTSTEIDTDGNGNTVAIETLTETNSDTGPASVLNYRDLSQNCSTISGYTYLAGDPQAAGLVTYDPCHPTILLPSQVKSIDPAWASCADNLIGGFYDPPYALTSNAGLQPFDPAPTTTATPAQTPQSDRAPSTTTTPTQPTTTSSPADPSSNTPNPPPTATSTPVPPTEPSSSSQPAPPASSDPASEDPGTSTSAPAGPSNTPTPPVSSNPTPGDPATSNPAPSQPGSTPTQNPSAPVIESQTLTAGGAPITVSGTVLSLEPSGSSVVVNGGSTVPLSAIVPPSQTPVVIGSQTLTPGGAPITVSGTVLSLAPSGGSVVINGGSTVPLTAIVPNQTPVAIGSQTLTPGGSPITVSGAAFSLEPSGGGVVVNGASTVAAASLEAEISSIISAPAVLGTQTLIPGGAPITVDGTTYSLQPTGGNVVVNGVSTIPLSSADQAISSAIDGAIGSAIASMIGASPTATTVLGGSTFMLEGSSTVPIASATGTSGPLQFTGGASSVAIKFEAILGALLGVFGGFILLI